MGVNYAEIIERMRWAGKLKNDSAVARKLSVTPQALSNYKKRGEMPTDLVLRFSKIYGLSVDWLISGEGEIYLPGARDAEGGAQDYLQAAEEGEPYGAKRGQRSLDFTNLSPDEIIYVGKLLKILRGSNPSNAAAIKFTVDAFLKAIETQGEPNTAQPSAVEK
ncbi:MAG: helix-turn-helix domain-containing protein [Proteobacteria bacterium]|nr:helix-turn-helix domain-containing protein [Pseudomonadota bacterium]